MFTGVKIKNGLIEVEGYPFGSTVHAWQTSASQELRRLAVFASDLRRVLDWVKVGNTAASKVERDSIAEACDEAALIVFCRCFESTSGLRHKPLKVKKVFDPIQRDHFERLRAIRNRVVAHDEQLFGGVFALVVRNPNHTALDVVALSLTAPFSVFTERDNLQNLAQTAFDWIERERLLLVEIIKAEFNALPARVRASLPPVTLTPVECDHFGQVTKTRKA